MKGFLTRFVIFGAILIVPILSVAASLHYSYDANGSLINDDRFHYEYNDANRLVRIRKGTEDGQVIAEYIYDHKGQRIKKIENGVTTYYIGKRFEKIKSDTIDNETNYFFANGKRVAKKENQSTVSFYHHNHLHGTDVVTNESGNSLGSYKYYPFGEQRKATSEKYSFTGKELSSLDGSYYFEARDYIPFSYSFRQADTVVPDIYEPQSLNRYSYVVNNPNKYFDVSGHAPVAANGRLTAQQKALLIQQSQLQMEAAQAYSTYAHKLDHAMKFTEAARDTLISAFLGDIKGVSKNTTKAIVSTVNVVSDTDLPTSADGVVDLGANIFNLEDSTTTRIKGVARFAGGVDSAFSTFKDMDGLMSFRDSTISTGFQTLEGISGMLDGGAGLLDLANPDPRNSIIGRPTKEGTWILNSISGAYKAVERR